MKIESLTISNFRGISDVKLSSLGSMIIIAGQNGSGKSCIFDAIRLLKSVYGGYQANEWQQWMGEFQINLTNQSSDFNTIFNDSSRELRIECDFSLSEEERRYIFANADALLREKIWRTLMPEAYGWGGRHMAMFTAQFRHREPEVISIATAEKTFLMQELASQTVRANLIISPREAPSILPSVLLSIIFTLFRPKEIGLIDYHGAQRHYGRETIQGINLNLDATNVQQHSQTALYNYSAKYSNVKSEMAASYVKEILAEQAGIPRDKQPTLTNTLKELFKAFFPEKEFLGPQPTLAGALSFPVRTANGNIHDLDELSSGEKEILYGYLRIRNSAPKFSIILLDEPELHLNPRLIQGLPQFYRKNLGEALQNQLWLVTHSDALLREVVGKKDYNVFHMLPSGSTKKGESQLKLLSATEDLDSLLVDLVGDLASYKPGSKVIILEGGGDSDFDQNVLSSLFPEIQQSVNLISGTNKVKVQALLEILKSAKSKGFIPIKFFAINDRDSDDFSSVSRDVNCYSWDVYHIENYFLIPKYINKAIVSLLGRTDLDENALWEQLRESAKDTIPQMVRHELSEFANAHLLNSINTGTDPKAEGLATVLFESISRSIDKIKDLPLSSLSLNNLQDKENEIRAKYNASIIDGTWDKKVKGREILRKFIGRHVPNVKYEIFRNTLLSHMKDDNFKPEGMKNIIDQIIRQ